MKQKNISKNPTQRILLLVLVCFFLSGLTSLIYQVLWTKMIVKIIGSAPFAVAIILTIFMAGLGLGSFLAARVIDRVKEPARLVRIYGLLELFTGVYALIIPLLLKIFHPLYAVLYNRFFSHFLFYNFLTFVGCFVILCIPVICMGATLPVLCRFYVTRLSNLGSHAGGLYGLNTIGAACGALLGGFWLISLLGVFGALVFAVSINIFIGVACITAASRIKTLPLSQQLAGLSPPASNIADLPHQSPESSFNANAAMLIFAVSGFCAMAYEVIWTKLLGLVVGPTTYSFTIVLVSFITGLALGSVIFGRLADRVKNIFLLLIGTQIATACFALVVSQLLGNSQLFFAKLLFTFQHNFVQMNLLKAGALFVFLFLPTVLSGATFPLVGKICTRSIDYVGRSIGFAYVLNTIGAVAGSFCAGFVLVPLLGKENSLSLVIGLQLLTVLIITVVIIKNSVTKWTPACLIVSSMLSVILCFFFPVWNRYLIASGRYHRFERIEMYLRTSGWLETFFPSSQFLSEEEYTLGKLVYYGDGIGGFTTVFRVIDEFGNDNYSLANSGKFDASSSGDATQTLLAHFPMLFHPNPKNVMVLGLASGITAGEVLCYPVQRLDIVEISTNVVKASHFFDRWNNNVLANPKTNLIIQDGRAHLYLTNRKYDVIVSEPSNPWMAGMADLFTRDFFAQARDRLNDGGILCQWVHAYQMDWPTFALICRTFADVFPNNLLVRSFFRAEGGDYLLIGLKGEDKLVPPDAMKKLPCVAQSKNVIIHDPKVMYPLIVSEDIRVIVGPGLINTDNWPRLEFEAPKTMYSDDPLIDNNIDSHKFLRNSTKNIVNQIMSDVNSQIDLSEYLFSVYTPPFGIVDLQKATPAQKQRFFDFIDNYCANGLLYWTAPEDEIGQRCRSLQIKTLKSKISALPNKTAAYLYLAGLYAQQNMLEDAVTAARYAVEIRPDLCNAHMRLGDLLVRQGKLKEATDCYQAALRIMPRNFVVYNVVGVILGQRSLYDEAVRHFKEAVRLNPNFAEAHANLGHALLEQKKIDEAIKHLTLSAKLNPGEPVVHNNLAQAFEKKGQIDDAVAHYQQAVKLKPDWAVPTNSLAWLLAVKKNARSYNPKEAVLLAQRACSLTKDSEPAVLDTLAAAYAANNQFNDAASTATKAFNLAQATQQHELAREIEKHLNLYKAGQPYHEP